MTMTMDKHQDYVRQATTHIQEAKILLLVGGGLQRPMIDAIERLTAAEILLVHAGVSGAPLHWVRDERLPLTKAVPKERWPMLYKALIESQSGGS